MLCSYAHQHIPAHTHVCPHPFAHLQHETHIHTCIPHSYRHLLIYLLCIHTGHHSSYTRVVHTHTRHAYIHAHHAFLHGQIASSVHMHTHLFLDLLSSILSSCLHL